MAAGLNAVSRLLALAAEPGSGPGFLAAVAAEARTVLPGTASVVLDLTDRVGGAVAVAGDVGGRRRRRAVDPADCPPLRRSLNGRSPALRVAPAKGPPLADLFRPALEPRALLLLPLRAGGERAEHVLVCASSDPEALAGAGEDLAVAFAAAAGGALAQRRSAEEQARRAVRQSALTRAAKTLSESLDPATLLTRIAEEATAVIEGDSCAIYSGTPDEGLSIQAICGLPPETLQYEMPRGAGLAGKVLLEDRPLLAEDYRAIAELPPDSPFAQIRSCVAVPIHLGGELGGVISVGYRRRFAVDTSHLEMLEAFAELAGVALRNASAHAGLERAARTDPLTGCLNHAALHEGLAREIERAERGTGGPLSLVLLDLDDFKGINDEYGHLIGDEVLRRVGHSLRSTTRPYDLAARYGGDEFALVTVDADEDQASEIAERAIERMRAALGDLDGGRPCGATAGIAEWTPDLGSAELIARADRALLHAKRTGGRGGAHAWSELPDAVTEARFGRFAARRPEPPTSRSTSSLPAVAAVDERLRKRTRQLALANQLGARLAAMTDVDGILDAAVDELNRAFGFYMCATVRLRPDDYVESAAGRGAPFIRLAEQKWCQHRDEGLIGRCLREGRTVLSNDVLAEPDYTGTAETADVRSELIAPVWVGEELWGVINVEEVRVDAFDEDDRLLVQTVADQVGSALRSAFLYQRLERAYLGTAEALAAALEAKDSYTAHHARSIVEHAEAVGRRLGMGEDEIHDLRLAAVFHDIGKIALPEAILDKRGPLTAEERSQIERHTLIGEQILAPVEFLARVRRLVRHEHERWDGRGYPDGLAGEEIPLGSRIVLACDALHAMTTDRPYRAAMSKERAHAELRRNAGTQFDPRVVATLLEVVGAADSALSSGAPRAGRGAAAG